MTDCASASDLNIILFYFVLDIYYFIFETIINIRWRVQAEAVWGVHPLFFPSPVISDIHSSHQFIVYSSTFYPVLLSNNCLVFAKAHTSLDTGICFVEHSSSHKPPWFELVHTFESHHSWKGCRWDTKYKFGLAGEAYQHKYIFENTYEERSLSVRHRPSTWVHRTRFCRWGIPAILQSSQQQR